MGARQTVHTPKRMQRLRTGPRVHSRASPVGFLGAAIDALQMVETFESRIRSWPGSGTGMPG